MGVGTTAITPGSGLKAYGVGGFDPFAGSKREAVQTGLISKGLEFETFKTGIVNLLPDSDEFERVAIPHPTVNQDVIAKLFRHVREADKVLFLLGKDGDGRALNFDSGFLGLAHGSVGQVSNSLEFDGIKTGQ